MGHLLQVSLSCHNQNREKVTTILGISTIPHRNGLTSDIIHAGQKLKIPKAAVSSALKVGDMVKVTASRYATGETVPGWVKERTHKVSQIEKDKVLLGWPDGIASWLPIDGVKKI